MTIFSQYDLERIMVLLNYEEQKERTWKIEISNYMKMHEDYNEDLKKKNEERLKKMEEEMTEMEVRANELREKGLCKVKFNPYIVQYKRSK